MNNSLFIQLFFIVAHPLQHVSQSRNKKNWPNKNNDVITDLGGGGNFPMFLFVPPFYVTALRFSRGLPCSLTAARGRITRNPEHG
jgi:hypothetical protein